MNEKWKQLDFLGYPKYKISNKGKNMVVISCYSIIKGRMC